MTERIQIRPNHKVALELTEPERKLVLDLFVDDHLDRTIRKTPAGEPIRFTLDDLDELGGWVGGGETPQQREARDNAQKEAQEKFLPVLKKYKSVFEELPKATAVPDKETPEAKAVREKKLKELQKKVRQCFEEGRPHQEVIALSQIDSECHGWVWLIKRR